MASNAYEYLPNARNFSASEWFEPEILKLVSAQVLQELDHLRDRCGFALHPSQLSDGWARTTGSTTSRHYAGGGLSIAGDFFPAGDVLECWVKAVEMPHWGGFGVYLDTNLNEKQPRAMMHLDLRTGPRVFWVRNEIGDYIYKHENPQRFWENLIRARHRIWT